jgi:hypothetical protein
VRRDGTCGRPGSRRLSLPPPTGQPPQCEDCTLTPATDTHALVAAWWDELPANRQHHLLGHRRDPLPADLVRSLTGAGIPLAGSEWTSSDPRALFTLPRPVQDYLDELLAAGEAKCSLILLLFAIKMWRHW